MSSKMGHYAVQKSMSQRALTQDRVGSGLVLCAVSLNLVPGLKLKPSLSSKFNLGFTLK